jgi:predicted alpha/beta-fold hydrolase
LPRFCRLIDFDEIVTVPMAGFKSRDEYYTKCSSINYAERIQTPTRILTTADDPFIPVESFEGAKFSSSVDVQIEKSGGHVGFLSRSSTGKIPRRWLMDYFQPLFEV